MARTRGVGAPPHLQRRVCSTIAMHPKKILRHAQCAKKQNITRVKRFKKTQKKTKQEIGDNFSWMRVIR